MTEKEPQQYDKSFIAIPITEGPFLDTLKKFNLHKAFFHITVLRVDEMDTVKLEDVKASILSHMGMLQSQEIGPLNIGIMGDINRVLVVKFANPEPISQFKSKIEKDFPEFKHAGRPFTPHVSIHKMSPEVNSYRDKNEVSKAKTAFQDIRSFSPKRVYLCHWPEPDTTALLFVGKLD